MKHHFTDFLDRSDSYWTIVPNRERFAYSSEADIPDKVLVKVLTIGGKDEHWKQVFECPNLEEVTLHEPNRDQIQAIQSLKQLRRLRVTFLRYENIDFIGNLPNLEELVLEYVSGFSDLTPLRRLKKIRSLHLENLRRVSDFGGLAGLDSLRYLHIDGTLDWKQPIENFSFLEGLPALEILSFGFVINKTKFPAFLPITKLKALQKVKIGLATFDTKEYAFLEAALSREKCCNGSGTPWTQCYELNSQYIEFIGKGAGNAKLDSPNAKMKISDFEKRYDEYRRISREILDA